MQHLCDKNDTCSFIAIFAHCKLVETGVSTVIYYGITALEATVIVLLAFVAIPYTFHDAVRRRPLFHVNLSAMVLFWLLHCYVYIFARAALLLFQTDALAIPKDASSPLEYLIVSASFLRYYQAFSCLFIFASVVFERSFATARIYSYERETRLDISIALIFLTAVLSGIFAYVIAFCISNPLIYACVSICFVIGAVCGLTVLFLHRTNSKRLERIVSWEARDLYTIGYKYQLLENLRAFKLLFSIGVYGSIGIVVAVAAIAASIVAWHFRNSNVRVLFGALFEAVNATTILVVIIAGQHSQWMWRHSVLLRMATRFGCFKRERTEYDNTLEMQEIRPVDVYFENLCVKWNEKYDLLSKSRHSLP